MKRHAPADYPAGTRIGVVTVLGRGESFGRGRVWRVRRACGAERDVLGSSLRQHPPRAHRGCDVCREETENACGLPHAPEVPKGGTLKNPEAAIVWRGIRLTPDPSEAGMLRSEKTPIDDHRSADWKVQLAGSTYYARLRVGSDRFPGRGKTKEEALDDALAEARLIARFIRAMSPKAGL